MPQKGTTPILIVILIALAVGGYFIFNNYSQSRTKAPTPTSLDETVYTEDTRSADWKTYSNTEYKYAVNYPVTWSVREFPDHKTGATFKPPGSEEEVITIDAMGQVWDERGAIPFEEYVKTAGMQEIQGYLSLNSSEEVVTKYGLKGFKTTWNVSALTGEEYISQPRTYFPLPEKYGEKTLQLSLEDGNYADIHDQMLKTIKYLE